ncbi:MAG: DNA polymerase III subunit delta [bacterium]
MANQIYLFYGDERFLIKQKIAELRSKISDTSLNYEQIDGSNIDNLNQLINSLQTQTLLMGNNLILVNDLDLKEKDWEKLCPALESMTPGTTVVFWVTAMNKRSRLYKTVDKLGEVTEFKSFADWEQDQVISWIERTTKKNKREIETAAARLLQEICGNNLTKLSSEIDKLITYIGDKLSITEDDVVALASPGEINVFALTDALTAKNLTRALTVWQTLSRNRVDYFPLLGLIANQYRIMLMSKAETNQTVIAQVLKTSPFYVRKLSEKARRFSVQELKACLENILETDLKMKTGEQSAANFELLLTSLCQPETAKV